MKVALVFICTGELYWEYAHRVIETAKKHFLPGKEVDYLIFSDVPATLDNAVAQKVYDTYVGVRMRRTAPELLAQVQEEENPHMQTTMNGLQALQKMPHVTFIPTEATAWPYPTLMRYHIILREEEKLKEYDYVFYCDIDMLFVDTVGEEILGDGITAAQHPMYAVRKEYIPPYEPNPESTSYIPRPGRVLLENGRPRFEPLYFAGGFQGGTSKAFIKAMHSVKRMVSEDLTRNYIPVWNDESAWNRYLFDNPPVVVLSPSYIYPDSLIKEYYEPLWGKKYEPRLVTVTKKFALSREGFDAVTSMIKETKNLQ